MIFSEDMMMQDKTGLMFLNYESWLPVLGNLIFGWKKIPQLLNKDARISGWFLRGNYQMVALRMLQAGDEKIRGFVKLGGVIGGLILVAIGAVIFFVL